MIPFICFVFLAAALMSLGLHGTAPQPGSGTTISYGASSSGSWTAIPLTTEISLSTPTQGENDNSTLASTFIELGPNGLPNLGKVKATFWYDPSDVSHQALLDDVQGLAGSRWFKIAFASTGADTQIFKGFAGVFEQGSAKKGEKLSGSVEITLQSIPTRANAGT